MKKFARFVGYIVLWIMFLMHKGKNLCVKIFQSWLAVPIFVIGIIAATTIFTLTEASTPMQTQFVQTYTPSYTQVTIYWNEESASDEKIEVEMANDADFTENPVTKITGRNFVEFTFTREKFDKSLYYRVRRQGGCWSPAEKTTIRSKQ